MLLENIPNFYELGHGLELLSEDDVDESSDGFVGRDNILYVHHVLFFDLDDAETVFLEFGDVSESEFVGFFFGILDDERSLVSVEGNLVASFEFVIGLLVDDQVHEVVVDEATALDFDFGLDLYSIALILEVVSGDSVSGPKLVALFRTKLIDFLRNQLPKTFEVQVVLRRLFQIILLSRK